MKITRKEFRMFGCSPDRVRYLKENQPLVSSVYTNSIYFINSYTYIAWHNEPDKDLDDAILRAINAACNVGFEFEDEEKE